MGPIFVINSFNFEFSDFGDGVKVEEGNNYDQQSTPFVDALYIANILYQYVNEIRTHLVWNDEGYAPYIENLLRDLQEQNPQMHQFLKELALGYIESRTDDFFSPSDKEIIALQKLSYHEYLKSEHWSFLRKKVLARASYRCQLCNASDTLLHVHHRSYESLCKPDEFYDLIALCAPCHRKFHNIPENENE